MNSAKSLIVYSTNGVSGSNRRTYVTVQINFHEAKLQLDTDSDIALTSQKKWTELGRPALIAKNASGEILKFED